MTGFFTGGGASLSFGNPQDPAAFPQFGNRWRGGMIIEPGTVQPQTDINTKEPIIRNGKVAEQLALPLLCDGSGPAAQAGMRTDERNPQDHTDTGKRVAYIKGALRFAIGDALRAAGASDLEVGGYLFMFWKGMGKSGNSKFIGRLWDVHYIRPSGVFLNSVSHDAPGFQNQAPPAAPGVGAMPMVNGAPQHTGFAPTQQPVTAPPQQGWAPAASAPVAPPNPYGQHNPPGSPAHTAAQQWQAQQPAPSPQAPNGELHTQAHGFAPQQWGAAPPQAPAAPPQSAAPASNPWGQAPEAQQPPQAPYGQPAASQQGPPAPPATGNPWQQ